MLPLSFLNMFTTLWSYFPFILASEAYVKLEIISNTYLKKDIPKLSKEVQTSCLESFHTLLVKFAPKSMQNMSQICAMEIQ